MGLLYVVQALLVSVALVVAAAAQTRLIASGIAVRMTIGLMFTPLALSLITLGIAGIWPGASRVAFLAIPATIALAALVLMRQQVVQTFAGIKTIVIRTQGSPRDLIGSVAFLFTLGAVGLKVIEAGNGAVTGNDALTYLSEARIFATERTLSSIPGFDAPLGQLVKAHHHYFLYQGYLAQALMGTDGLLGYGHDVIARSAMLAPLVLLPLVAVALARVAIVGWTIWLAAPLMMLVGNLNYIPAAYSADAFRMLPYLAFVMLLVTCIGRTKPVPWPPLVFVGVAAGLAAGVHTLNIVFVGLALLSLGPLAVMRLLAWGNLLRIGTACAPFLALVAVGYVKNWFVYGHPLGRGLHYFYYANSPLWDAFAREQHWARSHDLPTSLVIFAETFGSTLSILAAVSAVIVIGLAPFRLTARRAGGLAVVFLTSAVLPLMPLASGISIQGAMLSNVRYGLLVFALAGPLVAVAAALAEKQAQGLMSRKHWCGLAVAGVLLLGSTSAAVTNVWSWQVNGRTLARKFLEEEELFVASLAEKLPLGARWVTDRYTLPYFSDRIPIFLYSEQGRALIQASTDSEVRSLLLSMNIHLVALRDYRRDWWPRTQFYRTVTTAPGVTKLSSGGWQVYLLDPTAP